MSDPTIQSPLGLIPEARTHFPVSLSEIDGMGLKAARGCGYSWGLAEEAGRATRWLAAYGLAGPESLSATLTAVQMGVGGHAPKLVEGCWQATAGTLCPIALGACLSDRAQDIAAGQSFRAAAVLHPLLLLPFLARAARDLGCRFALEIEGITLYAVAEGPACADWDRLSASPLSNVLVAGTETQPKQPLSYDCHAYTVASEVWRALNGWAQRTYVPESEASRQSGAGSGGSDND